MLQNCSDENANLALYSVNDVKVTIAEAFEPDRDRGIRVQCHDSLWPRKLSLYVNVEQSK